MRRRGRSDEARDSGRARAAPAGNRQLVQPQLPQGVHAYCYAGRFDLAEEVLSKAADEWLGTDGYTHIFIRHSEIDSTTDAFFELMSDVRSGDAESAAGSYEKLLAHLSSLYTMERVTLGSIF